MSLSPRHALQRLAADERGLTTVEYVIVLCLIAAAAVGLWKNLGGTITDGVTDSDTKIRSDLGLKPRPL